MYRTLLSPYRVELETEFLYDCGDAAILALAAINGEPGIGNNEVPSGVGREYFEGNHEPDYNQDRNRRDF